MRQAEYREVLEHIRGRARESGRSDLDALEILDNIDDRSGDAREGVLEYLGILKERVSLRSGETEQAVLRRLRLAVSELPIEGIVIETDIRDRRAFGLEAREPLTGTVEATMAVRRADSLIARIAEDVGWEQE